MRVHLVLVSGDGPGVGKSYVADKLREGLRGFTAVRRMPFAEPLKRMLTFGLELPPRFIEHPLKEEPIPGLGVSARRLMQTLGTEWGRDTVGADFWLKVWTRRARSAIYAHAAPPTQDLAFIVDDVRFPNEVASFREPVWPDGLLAPEQLTIEHVHVAAAAEYVPPPFTGTVHPSEGYAQLLRERADTLLINARS
jgi:hypothetical protein